MPWLLPNSVIARTLLVGCNTSTAKTVPELTSCTLVWRSRLSAVHCSATAGVAVVLKATDLFGLLPVR